METAKLVFFVLGSIYFATEIFYTIIVAIRGLVSQLIPPQD